MKRTTGFTLVELLVVIAIISILASIAVPNITQYLSRARMTKAQAEINSIETAMTAILADSSRRSFARREFFSQFPDLSALPTTAEQIAEATRLYSESFYLIMKVGNDAGGTDFPFPAGVEIYDDIRRSLGNTYMDELGNDPWGKRYLFFPGPWSRTQGDIEFRRVDRDDDAIGERTDSSIITYEDPDTGNNIITGYPAPSTKSFYIWSSGANLVSNQLSSDVYQSLLGGTNIAEPDFAGGGDDVNNWDSATSYAQFYR